MAADTLYLREDLATAVGSNDPFVFFAGLEGEEFRALESRRTYAVELAGKRFFVKYHRGTGTGEILKNLLQLRLPVTSARNEWQALTRLQELGIRVPVIAAWGKRGLLPQNAESFIVTEDVGTQLNLEDLSRHWRQHPPRFSEKLALIREVAAISRTMHDNGICHRDFYICHFLVQKQRNNQLTLIDLHRALVNNTLGLRWIIKDVGSLYFSALDIGLTQRDLLRFVRSYSGTDLRTALGENRKFWRQVQGRAHKLKQRHG
jgi:heptose I phosphotransferase